MTETSAEQIHDGLRAWAKGSYATEAAVELLIRTGWANSYLPWVLPCEGMRDDPERAHWHWIDFLTLPECIGAYSGGEQRFLRLVASIGASDQGRYEVALGAAIQGLDRDMVDLILAALAHAAGTHEGSVLVHDDDGRPVGFRQPGTLHPWPAP